MLEINRLIYWIFSILKWESSAQQHATTRSIEISSCTYYGPRNVYFDVLMSLRCVVYRNTLIWEKLINAMSIKGLCHLVKIQKFGIFKIFDLFYTSFNNQWLIFRTNISLDKFLKWLIRSAINYEIIFFFLLIKRKFFNEK